jgi:hypothetical protein
MSSSGSSDHLNGGTTASNKGQLNGDTRNCKGVRSKWIDDVNE